MRYYSYLFCTIYDPASPLRIAGIYVLTNLQGPLVLTGIRNGNGNEYGTETGIGNQESVAGASTWNGGTACDRNTDSPKAKANQYTYVRFAGDRR